MTPALANNAATLTPSTLRIQVAATATTTPVAMLREIDESVAARASERPLPPPRNRDGT